MCDISNATPHQISRYCGAEELKTEIEKRFGYDGEFFTLLLQVERGERNAGDAADQIIAAIRHIDINAGM